jgi:hypothetical protein
MTTAQKNYHTRDELLQRLAQSLIFDAELATNAIDDPTVDADRLARNIARHAELWADAIQDNTLGGMQR